MISTFTEAFFQSFHGTHLLEGKFPHNPVDSNPFGTALFYNHAISHVSSEADPIVNELEKGFFYMGIKVVSRWYIDFEEDYIIPITDCSFPHVVSEVVVFFCQVNCNGCTFKFPLVFALCIDCLTNVLSWVNKQLANYKRSNITAVTLSNINDNSSHHILDNNYDLGIYGNIMRLMEWKLAPMTQVQGLMLSLLASTLEGVDLPFFKYFTQDCQKSRVPFIANLTRDLLPIRQNIDDYLSIRSDLAFYAEDITPVRHNKIKDFKRIKSRYDAKVNEFQMFEGGKNEHIEMPSMHSLKTYFLNFGCTENVLFNADESIVGMHVEYERILPFQDKYSSRPLCVEEIKRKCIDNPFYNKMLWYKRTLVGWTFTEKELFRISMNHPSIHNAGRVLSSYNEINQNWIKNGKVITVPVRYGIGGIEIAKIIQVAIKENRNRYTSCEEFILDRSLRGLPVNLDTSIDTRNVSEIIAYRSISKMNNNKKRPFEYVPPSVDELIEMDSKYDIKKFKPIDKSKIQPKILKFD